MAIRCRLVTDLRLNPAGGASTRRRSMELNHQPLISDKSTEKVLHFTIALLIVAAGFLHLSASEFTELAKIRSVVKSKRVGSYDRSGGNGDNVSHVADGAKVNIMEVTGAGIITHIWITLAPGAEVLNRNDVILRIFRT